MNKVMIIHHSGNIGGAGVSCYNTTLSLMKKYKVVVYVPSQPNYYADFLESKGIDVKTFSFPLGSIPYYSGGTAIYSPNFFKNVYNIKKYKNKWIEIISSENPDLVIANSKTTSWLSSICNNLKIKSLCFVRETRKKSLLNIFNSIQCYYLDKFSGVIFISEYDREQENLKKTVTKVIPNYIDVQNFIKEGDRNTICERFMIPKSGFNILFVGGMLRIKGFDVAVKAMKYLKNYNVNLIVAGDPNFRYSNSKNLFIKIYNIAKKRYEENISKVIENYDLEDRIYKIGIQKDMSDVYELADVLIFPANEPHQARPAFEAGAKKIPVIMPDFKNTEEYVKNEKNGLIFKRRCPKSLANCIIRLISDPELKNKLGEENYKQTMKTHTKVHSEKLLMDMVNNLINK